MYVSWSLLLPKIISNQALPVCKFTQFAHRKLCREWFSKHNLTRSVRLKSYTCTFYCFCMATLKKQTLGSALVWLSDLLCWLPSNAVFRVASLKSPPLLSRADSDSRLGGFLSSSSISKSGLSQSCAPSYTRDSTPVSIDRSSRFCEKSSIFWFKSPVFFFCLFS